MENKKHDITVDMNSEQELPLRELMNRFDWNRTTLGSIDRWPIALDTSVSICLYSNFPVLILWGPQHIQLYNDAYRRLIGKKHPAELGSKASETWQESNWKVVAPILEAVLKEGKPAYLEDHKFVSVRNGFPEERHYSISYTPIYGGSRVPHGIFVTVLDKTDEIRNERVLERVRSQPPEDIFLQSPIAVTVFKGPQMLVEAANRRSLQIWGKTPEQVLHKPLVEVVPAAEAENIKALLQKVLKEGQRVLLHENLVRFDKNGETQEVYLKVVYEPVREDDGSVSGVIALADDITEQVTARKLLEENESRLKLTVEAAEIGTFEWDMQSDSFQCSERQAKIFGFKAATGLSRGDLLARIHPDDLSKRIKEHDQALITGHLSYEVRIIWPDKSLHWVRVKGMIVFDGDRKPLRMYGATLDISEQKTRSSLLEQLVRDRTRQLQLQYEKLKANEERYHEMVDQVQDYAIILLDKNGNIQNWNRGAEKIKGYTASEIVGKSFTLFYPPESRRENLPERLLEEARVTGKALQEGWRVRKDETRFWGSIVITALHNETGQIIGFSKVTRDLTERKSAEEKLHAYMAELEAQNKELEQFAYVASHDLQEPLRKIQTFTEIIQQNSGSEETVLKYADKIDNSAKRMSDLIKAVLNYSQLNRESQFVTVDLNQIMENVKSDFELVIQEKNAQIQVDPLPSVQANPLQINQLLANLISNALKFSGDEPLITICARQISENEIRKKPEALPPGTYHELKVTDNGIGFEQQYAEQIFHIFQRLHGKQKYSGTGIGLAICKKIAENHKGHIAASSTPGKGTTFYLYLPTHRF